MYNYGGEAEIMRNSRLWKTPFSAFLATLFSVLILPGASRAAMTDYCQIPTYAFQSVIPSVSFLISNSKSMLNFAYGDPDSPENLCTDNNAPCGGFNNGTTYYGYFDNNSWYTYDNAPGGIAFKRSNSKPVGRPSGVDSWDGNFLNWLTLRRIDVVRKVITGGEGRGYATCLLNNARYKKFPVNSQNFTPFPANIADNILVTFNQQNNCDGLSLSNFAFSITTLDNVTTQYNFDVKEFSSGPRSGIYQDYAGKAQMEFFFYNGLDDEGAATKRGINGTQPPTSTMLNLINTPSNYNGIANAPLGEALWTIVGHYALSTSSSGADNGGCPAGSECGPKYHNNDYSIQDDPYKYYGSASQCVKGNVIVISDGEPCADGNLPSGIKTFANNNDTDFLTKCSGNGCSDASALGGGIGIPTTTINPTCTVGNAAGFERVALFAHTQDLRQTDTFDGKNLGDTQNLDIYVIRAFGSDNSNILKYGAINGSFKDSDGNRVPSQGEFDISGGANSAYFMPDNGDAIKRALDSIFFNILKRATSGTAASVLASGEGSGANLVQAVFYPKRNFSGDVIEWTGTLHNFWYYIDPYFGNSSIREDSDQNNTLNLYSDKTLTFRFDPDEQLTKADLYANDSSTGNPLPNATPNSVSFEEVKSLWEAGKFLHTRPASSRTIFTVTDATPGNPKGIAGHEFTTTSASYDTFAGYLGVGSDNSTIDNVINYVRGVDNEIFRSRTVLYPAAPPNDNTVWKLGDIINSTPKVIASIPLNKYDTTYKDSTYKTFTDNATYKDRGMVFAGANDGMLHAFKLGKLVFPGDSSFGTPSSVHPIWDRARLLNLDTSVPLGQEQWGFIPKNALPYLQALQDNNYCHLYYVDLAPQVFDASIGGDNTAGDASHKDWKTVLIGGMRFGGACRDNTVTCTDCVKSPVSDGGLSSYFAMDVTNPESPSVLWEFPDKGRTDYTVAYPFSSSPLGFATTGPAIVRINATYQTTNGNWYAVFGSGPTGPISSRQFLGRSDQNLKLFIVDLKTGKLMRIIDTLIPNAFAGSMINSTADFNLDYTDDVLYVGYVQANGGIWNQGGVGRLQTKGSVNPNDWEWSRVIDGVGPVTSAVVRLQNNNTQTNWIFFGTGRYYYFLPGDNTPGYDDANVQRTLYGIKEPCFVNGTISPGCTTTITASLTDRSTASSTAITGPGWFINLDTGTAPIAYDNTGTQSYLAERVITDPLATTAGTVLFTTFRPYSGACAIGGRTFLWAVQYDTGGVPPYALQGKAMMQVSTASVEQLDLKDAFSKDVPGANASLHRGGRRSYSMEGVPPTSQGLSLLVPPPPVKRILHMKER